MTAGPPEAESAAVSPAGLAHVLVPLDDTTFSEAALAPARQLVGLFGARLHLVAVGIEQAEAQVLGDRMRVLAEGFGADVETRVDWDVEGSILAVAGEREATLVCMASHGRGRITGALLGSVGSRLLADGRQPVILVGPDLDPARQLTDGPVTACVDGSEPSEAVLPVAAAWATALGVPLHVATVVRRFEEGGPTTPEQGYVESLAASWRSADLDAVGIALESPNGPAEGLAAHLRTAPGGLVAVTTHARSGLARALLGSEAAAIVGSSPLPVLAVPLPAG